MSHITSYWACFMHQKHYWKALPWIAIKLGWSHHGLIYCPEVQIQRRRISSFYKRIFNETSIHDNVKLSLMVALVCYKAFLFQGKRTKYGDIHTSMYAYKLCQELRWCSSTYHVPSKKKKLIMRSVWVLQHVGTRPHTCGRGSILFTPIVVVREREREREKV